MTKRIIYLSTPLSMKIKDEQLELRFYEKDALETIPVTDIFSIIIDNPQITITAYTLRFLMENKVAVVITDYSHIPSGIMLPVNANTIHSQRISQQAKLSKPLLKNLWKQIIKAKLKNQANFLDSIHKESARIRHYIKDIKSGDKDNKEGLAAAYYWKQMFGKNFTRDRYGDYPNMYLNFGYIIVRSIVAREIVAAGLSAALGIHHSNKYNAFCLADDLMEPYRPFIDRVVYKMVLDDESEDLILSKEDRIRLISISFEMIKIKNEEKQLMNAIADSVHSFVRIIEEVDDKIVYPDIKKAPAKLGQT